MLAAQARAMQPDIDELQRRILGRDTALSGVVRLNTGHIMMRYLLADALASFARQHSGIQIEVTEASALVDLSRRDADVALRISHHVPEHLIGRPLGEAEFVVCAKREAEGLPHDIEPLANLLSYRRWIGFERDHSARFYERWMNAHIGDDQVLLRIGQLHSMISMLHTGLGIGVLPRFAVRHEPGLAEVSEPIAELRTPVWLLTHPDLRGTARVHAFNQHLAEQVSGQLRDQTSIK